MRDFLRPSSADRWLKCPASVWLSEKLPALPSSSCAQEGTRLHALASTTIREIFKGSIGVKSSDKTVEIYAQCILRELGGEKIIESGVEKSLECKIGKATIRGTCDAFCVTSSGRVLVFDLKTGETPVKAKGNGQLAMYATAILASLKARKIEAKRIVLSIVQPPISTVADRIEMSVDDLRKQVVGMMPLIDEAWTASVDSPRVSGEHCTYCPARSVCFENALGTALLAAVATAKKKDLSTGNIDDLSRYYCAIKDVSTMASDIAGIIKHRLDKGEESTILRQVVRKNREWCSDDPAVLAEAIGCSPDDLQKTSLITVAAAEKMGLDTASACFIKESYALIRNKTKG